MARPICIALVDDYDVVLVGLAHLFDEYRDRIVVAEIDVNKPVIDDVDIALYDTFAQPEADHDEIEVLVSNPRVRRVAVYTWNFHPHLVDERDRQGSERLPVQDVAGQQAGDGTGGDPRRRRRDQRPTATVPIPSWPRLARTGRRLTDREAEVLALITQGKTNAELAELMYLSINTIKAYIRSAYRKIGVSTRTHAVLWGTDHGFRPDDHRIEHWRGGP